METKANPLNPLTRDQHNCDSHELMLQLIWRSIALRLIKNSFTDNN